MIIFREHRLCSQFLTQENLKDIERKRLEFAKANPELSDPEISKRFPKTIDIEGEIRKQFNILQGSRGVRTRRELLSGTGDRRLIQFG